MNIVHGEKIERKERRGKILILTEHHLKICEVNYGNNNTEVLRIQIPVNKSEKCEIITAYVPPKTVNWSEEKYKPMLQNTEEILQRETKGNKKAI